MEEIDITRTGEEDSEGVEETGIGIRVLANIRTLNIIPPLPLLLNPHLDLDTPDPILRRTGVTEGKKDSLQLEMQRGTKGNSLH